CQPGALPRGRRGPRHLGSALAMTVGTVDVDIADRIAVITMNRPEKRNALSVAFLAEVVGAVEAADGNDDVDVMILTGADPAFCAGLDLEEIGSTGGALKGAVNGSSSSPWPAISKPLIGAVNGVAV